MTRLNIIGLDPGLVDTGAVHLLFLPEISTWQVDYAAFAGNKEIAETIAWCRQWPYDGLFIEAYKPRSHFGTDPKMTALVHELKRGLTKSVTLDNTGVKKVITQELMDLLGVWKFTQTTHHQDLRSAARIGLYGMVKNADWNPVLAQLVEDFIENRPWRRLY